MKKLNFNHLSTEIYSLTTNIPTCSDGCYLHIYKSFNPIHFKIPNMASITNQRFFYSLNIPPFIYFLFSINKYSY